MSDKPHNPTPFELAPNPDPPETSAELVEGLMSQKELDKLVEAMHPRSAAEIAQEEERKNGTAGQTAPDRQD